MRELPGIHPHVMVGYDEEIVSVSLVPSGDELRRRVAVALECVRMCVALEPSAATEIDGLEPRRRSRIAADQSRRRSGSGGSGTAGGAGRAGREIGRAHV